MTADSAPWNIGRLVALPAMISAAATSATSRSSPTANRSTLWMRVKPRSQLRSHCDVIWASAPMMIAINNVTSSASISVKPARCDRETIRLIFCSLAHDASEQCRSAAPVRSGSGCPTRKELYDGRDTMDETRHGSAISRRLHSEVSNEDVHGAAPRQGVPQARAAEGAED